MPKGRGFTGRVDKKAILDSINLGYIYNRIADAKANNKCGSITDLAAIPRYQGVDKFHKCLLQISKYKSGRYKATKKDEITENAYKAYEEIEKAYQEKKFSSKVEEWCKKIKLAFTQEHTSGPGESSGGESIKDAPLEKQHEKLVAIYTQWMFGVLDNVRLTYGATNTAELATKSEGKFKGAQHCWNKMTLISNYQYYSQQGNFSSFEDAMEAYREIETKCKNGDYGETLIEYCKGAGFRFDEEP